MLIFIMYIPLLYLCLQTLLLWFIVAALYHQKNKITLIPLYSFIAILTIFTQNFSDLGFAVTVGQWYFFIASFSYFTPIMFAILTLYLFEGPKAARRAFWTVLFSIIFYVLIVYLTGIMSDTTAWITINSLMLSNHFWSLFAFILDIIFMAIFWETLSKIKQIPLIIKIFFVTLAVFTIDSFIYTLSVYGSSDLYLAILKGNLLNRFILSIFATFFINYSLKSNGFSEENRVKPKNVFEILNFKSDLEIKIKTLEKTIVDEQALKQKIMDSEETFQLAINGAGAGIWDWNTVTDEIYWSPKFCTLLGYQPGEIITTLNAFKEILHPDEVKKTFDIIDNCLKSKLPYETEYRLKTKSGEYKWFLANGVTKYDKNDKPIRMVGSIININDKKITELKLNEKVEELTQLNSLMVGRELKMTELKDQINKLKK